MSLTVQADDHTAVLKVTASDRPGLLANIALVLLELGLEITSARITTLGERVEDVFVVTRADGEHIRDAQQCCTTSNKPFVSVWIKPLTLPE